MPVPSLLSDKMDASGIFVVVMLLSYGGLSNEAPQDEKAAIETASAIATNDIQTGNATIPPPSQNCTTAKGLSGVCVDRQYCDYGTVAVDLTLFATREYKKSCSEEKYTCCPFGYQIPEEKSKWTQDINNDDEDF